MNVLNIRRMGENMLSHIEWLYGEKTLEYEKLINKAIRVSLEYEGIETEIEIGVTIVDDAEMQKLNKTYRGIDTTTDVLSFPMVEYNDIESNTSVIAGQMVSPESGRVYLGDIILSWDKVVEQSKIYGHTVQREIGFLVVHSLLHLVGYDHMIEKEEKVMNQKQEAILKGMGVSR